MARQVGCPVEMFLMHRRDSDKGLVPLSESCVGITDPILRTERERIPGILVPPGNVLIFATRLRKRNTPLSESRVKKRTPILLTRNMAVARGPRAILKSQNSKNENRNNENEKAPKNERMEWEGPKMKNGNGELLPPFSFSFWNLPIFAFVIFVILRTAGNSGHPIAFESVKIGPFPHTRFRRRYIPFLSRAGELKHFPGEINLPGSFFTHDSDKGKYPFA